MTEAIEVRDVEERRLKRAKISLMRNPMFALWQGIMMVGKTEICDDVPTACTDGRNEWYGREFIKELDDKELCFVILHENMHKALRHMTTWRKLWDEDSRLANCACDYVINLMIVDMDTKEQFISVPQKDGKPRALIDGKFKGMNSKQVFDILKQEQADGKAGRGEGFDEHDWEGAKEMSEGDVKTLEREIDQALRQGQIAHKKICGKGAGGMNRELGDLLEPQIDWREVMREFVKSICSSKDTSSWRRVNRRFLSSNVYMPTLVGESIGSLVIGIDTSGSIGTKELNTFLSEVQAIANDVNPQKVDLIYWDSEVASHEEYDTCTLPNIVSSTKPRGGGGTDVNALFDYIKKEGLTQVEVCIIFTDGYTPYPTEPPPYPVLWVMNSGEIAPFGKTTRVRD